MNKRMRAMLDAKRIEASVKITHAIMARSTREIDVPLSTEETTFTLHCETFGAGKPSKPQYKRQESRIDAWLRKQDRHERQQLAIGQSTPITVNRPYTTINPDGVEVRHNHYVPLFPARVNPLYRIRRATAEKDSRTGVLGVGITSGKPNGARRIIPPPIITPEQVRLCEADLKALDNVETLDARAKRNYAASVISMYKAQLSGNAARHDDSRRYTYRKPFGRSEIAKYRETVGYTAPDPDQATRAANKATLKTYRPIGRAVITPCNRCALVPPLYNTPTATPTSC